MRVRFQWGPVFQTETSVVARTDVFPEDFAQTLQAWGESPFMTSTVNGCTPYSGHRRTAYALCNGSDVKDYFSWRRPSVEFPSLLHPKNFQRVLALILLFPIPWNTALFFTVLYVVLILATISLKDTFYVTGDLSLAFLSVWSNKHLNVDWSGGPIHRRG